MNPVPAARAIENMGLEYDKHAIRDSSRQVLLVEQEVLEDLRLSPGDVKENITTSGVRLMALVFKDKIEIGKEVILEVTRPCSPCSRMEEIRPGLLRELAGRRGMLTRVIKGGDVSVGDEVRLLKA